MTTVATYENARAAFKIGREEARRGLPSTSDQWDNPGLAKAHEQGRASVSEQDNKRARGGSIMVLAALAVILLVVAGIFFQLPMWVMGCGVIVAVLCVFLGD